MVEFEKGIAEILEFVNKTVQATLMDKSKVKHTQQAKELKDRIQVDVIYYKGVAKSMRNTYREWQQHVTLETTAEIEETAQGSKANRMITLLKDIEV